MHLNAVGKGDRVLIIHDLLTTGGMAKASCELVESLGAKSSPWRLWSNWASLTGGKDWLPTQCIPCLTTKATKYQVKQLNCPPSAKAVKPLKNQCYARYSYEQPPAHLDNFMIRLKKIFEI